MFLAFFHCLTILISIIVIFCVIFFCNFYQITYFQRLFFQLPMHQLCQAQKVNLLFVPTHHHQLHQHLLFPSSQNLTNLPEDKQFLVAEHSTHTFKAIRKSHCVVSRCKCKVKLRPSFSCLGQAQLLKIFRNLLQYCIF